MECITKVYVEYSVLFVLITFVLMFLLCTGCDNSFLVRYWLRSTTVKVV